MDFFFVVVSFQTPQIFYGCFPHIDPKSSVDFMIGALMIFKKILEILVHKVGHRALMNLKIQVGDLNEKSGKFGAFQQCSK